MYFLCFTTAQKVFWQTSAVVTVWRKTVWKGTGTEGKLSGSVLVKKQNGTEGDMRAVCA